MTDKINRKNNKKKLTRTDFIIDDMILKWKSGENVTSSEYIAEAYDVNIQTARGYIRMFNLKVKEEINQYDLPTLVLGDLLNLRDDIQKISLESKTVAEKEKVVQLKFKYIKDVKNFCDSWDLSYSHVDKDERERIRKNLEQQDVSNQPEHNDSTEVEELDDNTNVGEQDEDIKYEMDEDFEEEELDDSTEVGEQDEDIKYEIDEDFEEEELDDSSKVGDQDDNIQTSQGDDDIQMEN